MTHPFNSKIQPNTTAANPFFASGGATKTQNAGSVGFGKPSFGSSGFGSTPFGNKSSEPAKSVFGAPSNNNNTTAFGKKPDARPAKTQFGSGNESETKRKGRGFQDRDASASEGEGHKRKPRGDAGKNNTTKKQNGHAKPVPNGTAAPAKQAPFGGARQNKGNNATGTFGSGGSFRAASAGTTSIPASLLNSTDPFARKVYTQLHQDGIGPPAWPSQPGDPNSKAVMAKFRDEYEEYRARVRTSLTNAGLIDDPNKRKRLDEAIDFRGIGEDMCPEYEKITRITEFDVVHAEKDPETKFANTQRMVKKLARSAAGQEAPLPMDVRSAPTLRRTMDYLIDDLLHDDDNLPAMHGFLWDRTRAIRRDFTFFSTLGPEDIKTQVYVLENIARFHATSLHLLSQPEITPEDFVEQQENEQLGKALLSLRDLYDDCNVQGIACNNEAEFRAYYLLFHALDPNIMDTLQRQWKPWLWKESDEVRTAVSLVEALQNTRDFYGPLKPAPTLAAAGPVHSYFRIVEDPAVSYTMACFAEIHFSALRNSVLTALAGALGRPKAETRDVTAASLNEFLRFDTVEQAISYAEKAGLDFEDDEQNPGDVNQKRLVLQHRQQVDRLKLPHQFSQKLVERKRGDKSLPEVIHTTVWGAGGAPTPSFAPKPANNITNEGSLFVQESEQQKLQQPAAPTPSPFGQPAAQPPNGTASSTPWGFSATPAADTQTSTAPASIFTNPQAEAKPGSFFPSFPSQTTQAPAFSAPRSASPFAPAISAPDSGKTPEAAPSNPFANLAQPKTTTEKPTQNGNVAQPSPFAAPKTNQPSLFDTKPPSSTPATSSPSLFAPATTSSEPGSGVFPTAKPTTSTTTSFFPPASTSTTETEPLGSSENPAASVLPEPTKTANPSLLPAPKFSLQPPAKDKSTAINPSPLRFSVNASPTPSASSTAPSVFDSANAISAVQGGPASLFSGPAPPAPPAKVFTPAPKRDYIGDFSKWFLLGDDGLMDEFKIFMVDELLRPLYTEFVQQEKEKREKEEEAANNEKAEKWRVYNLQLKFFYRWKNNAREKRQRFLRRSGRDQMREFWRQAEAEKKEKRAREEEQQRAARQLPAADRPAEFREMLKRRKTSSRQTADELLASGVLSGIPNEREAIVDIVYSGNTSSPASSIADGSSAPSFAKPAKKEGAKTRALRESLLGKSSRKSLPAVFSQRSTSPASSASPAPAPAPSKVSERWRLKAMGFVQMPDGTVLREELADQYIYGGKKYHGAWGASNRSASQEDWAKRASFGSSTGSARHRASSYSTPSHGASLHRSTLSVDQTSHRRSAIESSPAKRKRANNDECGNGEDVSGDTPPQKRTVSDLLEMANKVRNEHKEIREMLDEMLDQDKEYYKEASEHLGSEAAPSRGGSPWRVSGGLGV